MKTKFYLRQGSEKNTINFEFRNGSVTKFRLSTGFVVNSEKDWDFKKQKMKLTSSTVNAKLINRQLSEFENLLNDLLYKENEKLIGVESIRLLFAKVFDVNEKPVSKEQTKIIKTKPKEINQSKDLLIYFDWFLEFYSKNNSPYSKRILTKGTLTTLKTTFSIIKKYLVARKLKTLHFDDINRNFYNDFILFLNEKGYTKNYTGTVIQKLKTVMNYAFDEGKHTNLEFKKNYFSKMSEVVHHPYLNKEELKQIEDLVLTDAEVDLARDIFLVQSHIGLRIGDLLSFIKNPVYVVQNGRKFMNVKQSKTSNIVYIPLMEKVLGIMHKYEGQLPDYLHQNIINAHLKSICKKAKINAEYQYTRTEGGKSVNHKMPKYKFISTHTARRSFCTNAYNAEIPIQDIMAISGHKSERVFLNYIKVDSLKNAERVGQNPYFK